MKKILIFLMAFMLNFGIVNAQVAPAKFFDNTTVVIKGGATTPLNSFDKLSYEQVGVEVEKGITPWLTFAADGNFYMGNKEWNMHPTFDKVNVNALAKFNVFNLFGKFNGERRVFEMSPFTGLGWGHYTCSDVANRNFPVYKAGIDFDFNLGKSKAFALRLQPAVVWDNEQLGKLNKHNGEFELNVGVLYHFKNHDGNRTFTMVKPYNQEEIDQLNDMINGLKAANLCLAQENDALKNTIVNTPTQVTNIVAVENPEVVMLMPRTQFLFNSDKLIPEVEGNVVEMAEYMKANPNKKFTVIGYASEEGNPEYNMTLSENRAKTLRDKLVGYGVNSDQLLVKGAGATDKFSENNRNMNRVVIVEEK